MSRRPAAAGVVRMLSALLIGLGIAIIARTIREGAGLTLAYGYLIGLALIIAGGARAWLLRGQQRSGGEG